MIELCHPGKEEALCAMTSCSTGVKMSVRAAAPPPVEYPEPAHRVTARCCSRQRLSAEITSDAPKIAQYL